MTSRWLRLIRIHTSSLTQAVVLLGFVLAGERDWRLWSGGALFAVIYHAAGFIFNNICDSEYDRRDPAKKHFPLISGEIPLARAKRLYFFLTLVTLLTGIWLSKGRALSLIFLVFALAFGHLYNWRSKRDIISPVYITIAFISLPLITYFAHTPMISLLMGLVILYLTFLMMFQIAVEGYMKDIDSDRLSLLGWMGTRYTEKGKVTVNTATRVFSWSLKMPAVVLFLLIWSKSQSSRICLVIGLLLVLGMAWSSVKLLESGFFDNQKRVRLCAVIEILTYFLLVVSLQGRLGWVGLAFFILYPLGWFVLLNRLTWGTLVTPRV